jgi:hypothetical protein
MQQLITSLETLVSQLTHWLTVTLYINFYTTDRYSRITSRVPLFWILRKTNIEIPILFYNGLH